MSPSLPANEALLLSSLSANEELILSLLPANEALVLSLLPANEELLLSSLQDKEGLLLSSLSATGPSDFTGCQFNASSPPALVHHRGVEPRANRSVQRGGRSQSGVEGEARTPGGEAMSEVHEHTS